MAMQPEEKLRAELRNTELKHAPAEYLENVGKVTDHEINTEAFRLAQAALEFIPQDGSDCSVENLADGLLFEATEPFKVNPEDFHD